MMIIDVWRLRPALRYEDLRSRFSERLLRYDRFRQKPLRAAAGSAQPATNSTLSGESRSQAISASWRPFMPGRSQVRADADMQCNPRPERDVEHVVHRGDQPGDVDARDVGRLAARAALLCHLLSKLCEHTSVVITTHLDFAEGSAVCVDLKMTTARWDRPWHHGHSVETGDESCRVTQVTTRTK